MMEPTAVTIYLAAFGTVCATAIAIVDSRSGAAVKRHQSIAQSQPASGQPDSALAGSQRR
jgi:hypothetical protein